MDLLTENIEKDQPWAMVFADDLVMCVMTHEEVDEGRETWTKTEYLPSPTNDTDTTVKIVDAELPTVKSF